MRLIHAERITYHSRKSRNFGIKLLLSADTENALPASFSGRYQQSPYIKKNDLRS
jgi:hypothetical protein